MKELNKEALQNFAKGKKRELKQGGRAVIYQRVSSKEQEYGFSPKVQTQICRDYAERHGFEVVRVFEGDHESAKTDVKRKRFQEMLAFVRNKKNKIDAVLVYSASRYSRSGGGAITLLEELEKNGIILHSVSEGSNSSTIEGKRRLSEDLIRANSENLTKGKAVRDSCALALRKGHWTSKAPLGYDIVTIKSEQTITVNETGALIRMAFKMKADENLSTEEVRRRMAELGLSLSKQTWSRIFMNIFYAGYFAHKSLDGDVIKGPQEPLVSERNFFKINNIVQKSHSRGYETKGDKEYAPLLGSLKCPVCGHNLTASLSTKMRKKYGREVGYYVCSHKGCKCNVPTKKANGAFEEWLDSVSLPEGIEDVLCAQMKKAFPILNKDGHAEVMALKTNLSHKESEIEKVEYNLALAPNAKVQNICSKQLEKLEGEREAILARIEEMDKEILNLDSYINFGLALRDNVLKLWQLSNLSQKRHIQNLVFPEGLVYSKENDDIEPLSKNEFMFVYDTNSMRYGKNKNGQTVISDDLSALAPVTVELLNLWRDFRKVVEFIDDNSAWLESKIRLINKMLERSTLPYNFLSKK